MNNENSPFNGFSEPEQFFKLGHSWFDLWTRDLKGYGPNRRSLLVITEYLIKIDWIIEKTSKQGCSSLEIKRGIMLPTARRRFDQGTQLDARVIKKSLQVLIDKNIVVEAKHQDKPYFRINRDFFPEIFVIENLPLSSVRNKDSTFFKVPNSTSELYKQTRSLTVILMLEYYYRHSWGYKNAEGVWLTANEIQHGREYSTGERYDEGIGFDKSTIYDALNECCSKGWMVVKSKTETGYTSDLYNLKFEIDNNALSSVQSVFIETKQENSEKNTKTQNFSIDKEFEKNTELNRESSPIVCDNRNMNWVLLEDYSCIDADNSWAIAYSSWLKADPFCDNAISVTDLNCDFSWEDVNLSRESALSDRVNAHGFCGDVDELQVKDTNNIQPQRNEKETTTSKYSELLDQKLAVAVVNGNHKDFLLSLGIIGTPLEKIITNNIPDEILFGWAMFNSSSHNCKSKSDNGFIVKRLLRKDSPPLEWLAIGQLTVKDWLDLIDIFTNHYSMASLYIPEQFANEANLLKSKIFFERESKLPNFLNNFTNDIKILQEDLHE